MCLREKQFGKKLSNLVSIKITKIFLFIFQLKRCCANGRSIGTASFPRSASTTTTDTRASTRRETRPSAPEAVFNETRFVLRTRATTDLRRPNKTYSATARVPSKRFSTIRTLSQNSNRSNNKKLSTKQSRQTVQKRRQQQQRCRRRMRKKMRRQLTIR